MDDDVGRREVEAHASRLQRDEEHRHVSGLECVHQPRALFLACGACEGERGDLGCCQALLDEREHACELREQKYLMSAIHGVVQKLHAGVELGRATCVSVVEQARVAADLAQLRELGENLKLVFLELLGRVLVLQLQRKPVLVGLV